MRSVHCLFDATWQISRSRLKSFGLVFQLHILTTDVRRTAKILKTYQEACGHSVLYSDAVIKQIIFIVS